MQILRNTPATLELQVFQAGTLVDLDANPTIAVTDANGTAVASGAVTKPAGEGVYRSVLPPQVNLSDLVAVWSGELASQPVEFTQHHQIVGNLLFTEAQARAWQTSGNQAPLTDALYTDTMIARMRELVINQFEEKTARSWVARYCRMECHGNALREIGLLDGHAVDVNGNISGGAGRLRDIRRLLSVTIDGSAVTLSEIKIHGSKLIHTTDRWTRGTYDDPFNVIVEYEYGVDPTPLEVNEEGLRVCVTNLVRGDISQWAQSFSGEDGTITYPQGGFVYPPQTVEWFRRNPGRSVLVA